MKLQSLLQRQNEGDEKDLPLVKLKFFDCLIMHFLSFQRFYMKEKVTFGFACVCVCARVCIWLSCDLHSSTCHNYYDLSLFNTFISSKQHGIYLSSI